MITSTEDWGHTAALIDEELRSARTAQNAAEQRADAADAKRAAAIAERDHLAATVALMQQQRHRLLMEAAAEIEALWPEAAVTIRGLMKPGQDA